jgi:hypothetical protein
LLSAKQIAPGQTGEIEVSVHTENLTTVNKTVAVTTNDPKNQQIMLSLMAIVEPEFALSERAIFFGNVPKGKEATKELIITVADGKEAKPLSAETTDQSVSVKLEPMAGSGGKKFKLNVTQRSDAKDGYHYGVILVKTSSSLSPELKIPVRGIVVAPQDN